MTSPAWCTAWWGTAANVADVTQVDKLLHGEENVVRPMPATPASKAPEHEGREVIWQIAARRSTYKRLDKRSALYKAKRKIEKAKAGARQVEHPFRVIKRQFGYVKVRFRGLAKNTAQLVTGCEGSQPSGNAQCERDWIVFGRPLLKLASAEVAPEEVAISDHLTRFASVRIWRQK